jgi:hypothetical protein
LQHFGPYDLFAGFFLLVGADTFATLFGMPPASPRIFSDLNALFLISEALSAVVIFVSVVDRRGWLIEPSRLSVGHAG